MAREAHTTSSVAAVPKAWSSAAVAAGASIAGGGRGGAEDARVDDPALAVQELGRQLDVGRGLCAGGDLEAADVDAGAGSRR